MGFHLVKSVYRNVVGTSSTAQAVLAFLAFTADDRGVRKCYPSEKVIAAATHFKHSSIANALNELREAQLLKWTRGGRHKGRGGRSLANEYTFNLPLDVPSGGTPAIPAARQPCPDKPRPIESKPFQPSDDSGPEASTAEQKSMYTQLANCWKAERPSVSDKERERQELKDRMLRAVVNEAMKACGDRSDNIESRKMFLSTLLRRDLNLALEVIQRFVSECRAGEHQKLNNPAGLLNSALSELPYVR